MAELPHVADTIPQIKAPSERSLSPPRIFTPQVTTPQVAVPQLAELPSPLRDWAHSMQVASTEANDIAKIMAKEAGIKAVTRDADGNVQVDKYPIVGDAAISFQDGVKLGAVADGDAQARLDLLALQKQHEYDPEGFRNAAAEYRKAMVSKYEKVAGPAVGLTIGKAIDNNAIETYRGLLNTKERIELTKAASSIDAQVETTTNELFALANGGDQSSPEYRGRLDKIGTLWGSLAANPRLGISPERVEFEIKHLNSQLTMASIDYRIGKIQAEHGAEAAYKVADTIKTDVGLELGPGERIGYHSRAIAGIQQRASQQRAVEKSVADEIIAVGKLVTEGFSPPPSRLAAVRQIVAESKNPALQAALENTEKVLPVISDWRKSSPAQLEQNISQINESMRMHGASEDLVALRDLGIKLLDNSRKEIAKDQLGWSDRTGFMPVPLIDFADPNATGQMRDRIARAETIAQHNGVATSYLRPDERALLEKATATGGQPMKDMARSLVDGFGDRAPRVLAEISKEAPVLAHIGGLQTGALFGGGSATFTNDVADGVALRSNPEAAKTLPHWVKTPTDKVYQFELTRKVDQYGDAFMMVPNNGRAAEQSAKEAFMVRAMRNGYDPQSIDITGTVKDAYNKALQEAAGATYGPDNTKYGGVTTYKPGYWTGYKVIVPGNVRTDSFRDVVGAITDDDLRKMPISPQTADGKSYSASDLRGAVPVAVPGGYRFAQGEPASDDPKWMRGADGNPFVLRIEAMEPILRKRVPQAYQGGR